MSTTKTETAPWVEAFSTPENETATLTTRRKAALDHFAELGLPTRRDEDWRYTDLRPLERGGFSSVLNKPTKDIDLKDYLLGEEVHRIVLLNGHWIESLSKLDKLPAGISFGPVSKALREFPDLANEILSATETEGRQAFTSLNGAFFSEGFVLLLEPGVVLDKPLQVLHLGQTEKSGAQHLRNLIRLAPGSRATLVESFAGEGDYWTNAATLVDLGEGATLHHVRLQNEGENAIHFASTRATLAAGSKYDTFTLTLGARLSRHDISAVIEGSDAHCALGGAFLLRGQQDATTVTLVDHKAPGCETRELYKGVVDERSHGAFLGKIAVRQAAQKTDAHQLSRNLLLSPRASVDTKPELEIYADDVKCSHGATVGDLDETALFYLQARGIPEAEARRMLIDAFTAEAIETVENEALRAYLHGHLERWLAKGGK